MNDIRFRCGESGDLGAITDIYNHYVETTAITFDIGNVEPEARRSWLETFAPDTRHQLWVAHREGEILGYACSGPLRPKAAYDTSVETTIYLHPRATGAGIGSALYGRLLVNLAQQDIHRCYGIITLPNDPSVALHRKFGFREVGRLHEVGHKFGRYWDTVWMELDLSARDS